MSFSWLYLIELSFNKHKICIFCIRFSRFDGDGEIRTHDPLLARQVLSQLSYTPIESGSHLLSHIVSNIVPSAACVLTVVFGMGTGVSHKRIDTTYSVIL